MTEKEKMLAGMMYDTSDPEPVRLRNIARDSSQAFRGRQSFSYSLIRLQSMTDPGGIDL